MSEKRFRQFGLWVIDDPNLKINTVADLFDTKIMSIEEVVDLLNEQQATINKLRKILAEAEDTIEVRLAEHYLKEYENIKHNIIGDSDE